MFPCSDVVRLANLPGAGWPARAEPDAPYARAMAEHPTTAPSEFDRATAVTAVGDGRFTATVDDGWTVGPKPNGGYLLAMLGRAAGDACAVAGGTHRDPLAATTHYLWAPDPGPADVKVDVLRTGRSASHVRATLLQDGRTCVEAMFTLGTLADEPPPAWWSGLTPLALPPIEDCTLIPAHREGAPFVVSIMDRFDLHLDPDCLGFTTGQPSGQGELRGWAHWADGGLIDPLSLLFFVDSFPPATFDLATTGWVPTLSLTAYVRARPAPGPLRIVQRAQVVGGERFDEVCEVWDAADQLVAHATQLAAIRLDPAAVAPSTAR